MKHPYKVAIAHDYLVEYGGAERVLESIHRLFPDAEVYTSFVSPKTLGVQWERFSSWKIHTSWAQKIPFIEKLYSPLRALSANMFRSFKIPEDVDVLISSTNMYMAKAIQAPKNAVHISYIHTPPRSLYGYSTMSDWKKNPVVRVGGEIINHVMRMVDFETAQKPDLLIANSKEVQKRIQTYYRRSSTVIYPPIIQPSSIIKKQTHTKPEIVFIGRLAASKHPDLVVKACIELKLPLTIIGTGKMLTKLQDMAQEFEFIRFEGFVKDKDLGKWYQHANVLVYPAEDEDFGMIPIEALSYGTPVVVHRSGGFLETIEEGEHGFFMNELSVQDCKKAVQNALKHNWNQKVLMKRATEFSEARFHRDLLKAIQKLRQSIGSNS